MVAGLGNPGKRYAATRHNVGFRVVDSLAEMLGTEAKKKKFGAAFCRCEFEGKNLILLKPLSFMNRSGEVIAAALGFYKLALTDLLVITDDMALEPGRIRIRAKGSAGGHNGLADIIEKLSSNEFPRLRIGIGKNTESIGRDYVLTAPSGEQKSLIDSAIDKARQTVVYWIRNGVESAMNEFNG